jgi:hypothetical protein
MNEMKLGTVKCRELNVRKEGKHNKIQHRKKSQIV